MYAALQAAVREALELEGSAVKLPVDLGTNIDVQPDSAGERAHTSTAGRFWRRAGCLLWFRWLDCCFLAG